MAPPKLMRDTPVLDVFQPPYQSALGLITSSPLRTSLRYSTRMGLMMPPCTYLRRRLPQALQQPLPSHGISSYPGGPSRPLSSASCVPKIYKQMVGMAGNSRWQDDLGHMREIICK
ncbi:hypothetical protein M404DRAFT_411895 [Pisolithus tinctorius Marx 270]|uniref:Uncharacterized protein n=1 Tax=Pisolithus tinctorius Marx 270 TaxID=870435 RepID=A0A0C3PHJ1_PISTI|nr:hypothetical protein M404DRAFT_411895 [Pisolithus tinctorius Marx 270]